MFTHTRRARHLRYFLDFKKIEKTYFFKTNPIFVAFLCEISTSSQMNLIKNAKNIIFKIEKVKKYPKVASSEQLCVL